MFGVFAGVFERYSNDRAGAGDVGDWSLSVGLSASDERLGIEPSVQSSDQIVRDLSRENSQAPANELLRSVQDPAVAVRCKLLCDFKQHRATQHDCTYRQQSSWVSNKKYQSEGCERCDVFEAS